MNQIKAKTSRVENEMVTVVKWPHNKLCMGCDHGTFIDGEQAGDSTYICVLAVRFLDRKGKACIGRRVDGELKFTGGK